MPRPSPTTTATATTTSTASTMTTATATAARRAPSRLPIRLSPTEAAALLVLLTGCQGVEPEPAYDGAHLFQGYCAACHGPVGAGDGPMAPHLATGVPDLRTLAQRHGQVYPADHVRAVIDGRSFRALHGAPDMPVWGYQFRREEGTTAMDLTRVEARIEALVEHIRGFQRP